MIYFLEQFLILKLIKKVKNSLIENIDKIKAKLQFNFGSLIHFFIENFVANE